MSQLNWSKSMIVNLFKKAVWVAVLLIIAFFAVKHGRQVIEKVSVELTQMWASMAKGRLDMLHAEGDEALISEAGNKQGKTDASMGAAPVTSGIWKCDDHGKTRYTNVKADADGCKALSVGSRPAGPFTPPP
jgi:hypothetical protein